MRSFLNQPDAISPYVADKIREPARKRSIAFVSQRYNRSPCHPQRPFTVGLSVLHYLPLLQPCRLPVERELPKESELDACLLGS
jgi:hypothetical protein